MPVIQRKRDTYLNTVTTFTLFENVGSQLLKTHLSFLLLLTYRQDSYWLNMVLILEEFGIYFNPIASYRESLFFNDWYGTKLGYDIKNIQFPLPKDQFHESSSHFSFLHKLLLY